MSFSLLVQLCGWPMLVVVVGVSVLLTLMAVRLAISVKHEGLLAAFLPLTFLPAVAALASTFMGSLSSVSLNLDSAADVTIDSGFLLQMNLVPLLFGLLATAPPALVTVSGRWVLAWKASGVRLLPERAKEGGSEQADSHTWRAKETEDYLDKITRPR